MKLFKDFWQQLILNIQSFISDNWDELKEDAAEDSIKFLTESKDDIKRWISQLMEGKLTKDEFAWLLKGKQDLAELIYLKAKGLAKPDLDKFFQGLTQTILSTALKLII